MKCSDSKAPFFYVFILLLTTYAGNAQQPTWENGIACIIYTHYSSCHNSNSIAPFPLMSYQDALENVAGIQEDVNNGTMPPYPPDRSYQHYQDERYLSDSEKLAINQWIRKGVPSGDLSKALTPPVFDSKSEITNPDFTVSIPIFTVPEITKDLYRCFVISNPFTEAHYISAIEVIPGNRSIVHHVQIYQDTAMIPVNLDSADILPGYDNFGGIGSQAAEHLTGWTPSTGALVFPDNMGILINPGSRIIVQIHYPVWAAGKVDSTRVNFKYLVSNRKTRILKVQKVLSTEKNLVNGPLVIPANKVKVFYEQYQLPVNENISCLGVASHAHLVCVSMKMFAVKPNGDTVPLLDIKNWDFHWQGGYMFKKMILLPGGSTLYGEAVYDNTTNNPDNPNNPPKKVKRGASSYDEMMGFYLVTTDTKRGDENLAFDTTTRLATYNNCGFVIRARALVATSITDNAKNIENDMGKTVSIYPNPVHDKLHLAFKSAGAAKVLVYNSNGQLVYQALAKQGSNQFHLQFLPSGFYFIKVLTSKTNTILKFVKQ